MKNSNLRHGVKLRGFSKAQKNQLYFYMHFFRTPNIFMKRYHCHVTLFMFNFFLSSLLFSFVRFNSCTDFSCSNSLNIWSVSWWKPINFLFISFHFDSQSKNGCLIDFYVQNKSFPMERMLTLLCKISYYHIDLSECPRLALVGA